VVGGFVAATIVSLLQFLRVRDRRMLLLAAMFAFQAQALAREWWDVWRDVFQAAVCAAGLLLLLALSPRHHPPHAAPAADAGGGEPPAPSTPEKA
jgi:hypothetical protein